MPSLPEQLAGREEKKKPQASQTLQRGLDIIEAVAAGVGDLSAIAQTTGMTYSTAHRILTTLQQRYYLRKDPVHGYQLGRKMLELGYRAHEQLDLVRLAHDALTDLAQQTADTVHLGYREQDNVIYLDKIASRRAVEISSRLGGNKPLMTTGIGKALLLDDSEHEWLALYDRSAPEVRAHYGRDEWRRLMRHYAQAGYSYDLGEDEPSIRCVAAPIRDGRQRIVAAVSVSSTQEYMNPGRMQDLVDAVQKTAGRISAELGHN